MPCVMAVGTRVVKSRHKDGVVAIKPGTVTLNDGLKNVTNGIVLLNYELLSAWRDELCVQYGADIIVLDEVHAVKEPKAARSKAAYG